MKRQLILLLALLPLLLAAQVGDLPRSTPAAEGISTQAVINMMDSLMALPECDIHHTHHSAPRTVTRSTRLARRSPR